MLFKPCLWQYSLLYVSAVKYFKQKSGKCAHFAVMNKILLPVVRFNRGKGDYFRLGHGTDTHVRRPQIVEGLKGKKIVHIAVGALHCLAVTDTGQVIRFHC
jgi:alpha-tubulin suppressor-like RCC1 family protein